MNVSGEGPPAPVLAYGNEASSHAPRISRFAVIAACVPAIDPGLFVFLKNYPVVLTPGIPRLVLVLPLVLYAGIPFLSLAVALWARNWLQTHPYLTGRRWVRLALVLSTLECAFILFSIVMTIFFIK